MTCTPVAAYDEWSAAVLGRSMKSVLLMLLVIGITGCQLFADRHADSGHPGGGCAEGWKLCPQCGAQAMCCTQKQSCQCTAGTAPVPYCR